MNEQLEQPIRPDMSIHNFVELYGFWGRVKGKLFTTLCRVDFARLGRRTMLQPPMRLVGAQHITIGDRVFVGSNSWFEVIDSRRPRVVPVIEIGDGTCLSGFCSITAIREVVIEPNVLIARYVHISDHTHAHASNDIPIKNQGLAKIAPVRICEGAWLGQNVVVCPGVTIGRNAVIGANSVVRDNIPDHCVAAGSPARVVRSNVPVPA
jgi:acetyltransferase-like isoleucine patch superfamily enzyme